MLISESASKGVIPKTPSWAALTYFKNVLGWGGPPEVVGSGPETEEAFPHRQVSCRLSPASPTPEGSWGMSGSDIIAHRGAGTSLRCHPRKLKGLDPAPASAGDPALCSTSQSKDCKGLETTLAHLEFNPSVPLRCRTSPCGRGYTQTPSQ